MGSKMEEKYVAYVSTYTQGDNHGIRIYDIDMENGRFYEKDKVQITNSSYVCHFEFFFINLRKFNFPFVVHVLTISCQK